MAKRKANLPTNKRESKRITLRTCIACRKKLPKKEMVRFVLRQSKQLAIDESGKSGGRGVNLCASASCFEDAVERGSFNRAWKTNVDVSDREKIEEELEKLIEQRAFRKGERSVTFRVDKTVAEEITGKAVTKQPATI